MSNNLVKAIGIGSCIASVGVTANAIKRMKKEPIQNAYYTIASTALWLYCIRTTTSIITTTC